MISCLVVGAITHDLPSPNPSPSCAGLKDLLLELRYHSFHRLSGTDARYFSQVNIHNSIIPMKSSCYTFTKYQQKPLKLSSCSEQGEELDRSYEKGRRE